MDESILIKLANIQAQITVDSKTYYDLFREYPDVFALLDIDPEIEIKVVDFNDMEDENEILDKLELLKKQIIMLLNKKFKNNGEIIYELIRLSVKEFYSMPEKIDEAFESCTYCDAYENYIKKYKDEIQFFEAEGYRHSIWTFKIDDDIDLMFNDVMFRWTSFNNSPLTSACLVYGVNMNKVQNCIKKVIKDIGIDEIATKIKEYYGMRIKGKLKAKYFNEDFIIEFMNKMFDEDFIDVYEKIIKCLIKHLNEEEKIRAIAAKIIGMFYADKTKIIVKNIDNQKIAYVIKRDII